MRCSLIAFRLAAVLLLAPTLWTPASADSTTLLNDVFDMYTNTTDPQVLESQQRGGFSMGSVYARVRVVRPQLVNFDPPQFRGGCQGIDLYGGSFSFINASQLVASLRAIAGSAVSYAFSLALDAVCPMCNQTMQKLRDRMDQINDLMQDSCHAAQSIVNATGLDEWRESRVMKASGRQVSLGVLDDMFDALHKTGAAETTLQKDVSMGAVKEENAVWEAMKKSSFTSWFGTAGDPELMAVVMSVTGTVLKTRVRSDASACVRAADGAQEYCISERLGLMTARDFIDGNIRGPIDQYDCGADTANCLTVGVVSVPWEGMRSRVHRMLFGPPPGVGGGIVAKMRNPTATLTAREQTFIQSIPLNLWNLLRDSAYDGSTLLAIAQAVEEVLAVQMSNDLLLEMISAVSKAFSIATTNGGIDMTPQMKEKLDKVESDIREQVRDFSNQRLKHLLELNEVSRLAVRAASRRTPVTEDSAARIGRR